MQYASKLKIFKDLLTKIKYTVEIIHTVKTILGVITNIAFIPMLVLATFLLFRKLIFIMTIFWTTIFSAAYFTNHLEGITTLHDYLISLRLTLKELSIKAHNYLFDDELVSKSTLPSDIKGEWSYYSYISDWLASYNIDSTSLAWIGGALISITTAYLVWNGSIDSQSVKKAWSWLLSWFSKDEDNDGDNPPTFPNAPTEESIDYTSESKRYFRNVRPHEEDNYSVTSEASKWEGTSSNDRSHNRNLSEATQAIYDEYHNPNTSSERANQLDQEQIARNRVKYERVESFGELPYDEEANSESGSDKTIKNKGKLNNEDYSNLASVP